MQYDIEHDGTLINVVLVNKTGEIVATVMCTNNINKARRMVSKLNNQKTSNKRNARRQARKAKMWEYVAE